MGDNGIAAAQYRDLYFYSLYRVLEAGLLVLILFGPIRELVPEPAHPFLGKATALSYLVLSPVLLYWALRRVALRWQVLVGILVDVSVAMLAIHALPAAASGVALMLVFNVGATAMLLPLRYGLAGGALAGAAMIAEYVWTYLSPDQFNDRPMAEPLMFAVSFLSIAMLCYLLGRQLRESQALAERRGGELADLAVVNELIIRRMRTGVLLVDGDGRIRLANEAALLQLGDHVPAADHVQPNVRNLRHRVDEDVESLPARCRLDPAHVDHRALPRIALGRRSEGGRVDPG